MGKYPVIFISFKDINGLTYDEAFDALVQQIGAPALAYDQSSILRRCFYVPYR